MKFTLLQKANNKQGILTVNSISKSKYRQLHFGNRLQRICHWQIGLKKFTEDYPKTHSDLKKGESVIGLDFFDIRETFSLLKTNTKEYKGNFKRLGTEPLGNFSIDRAISGII